MMSRKSSNDEPPPAGRLIGSQIREKDRTQRCPAARNPGCEPRRLPSYWIAARRIGGGSRKSGVMTAIAFANSVDEVASEAHLRPVLPNEV